VETIRFDTIGEAIIAAAGVNSTHGLKRKKGDIANAINAILEVEKMMFMDGQFKLNKRVIMETVNCSARTYEVETKEIREKLEGERNYTIKMKLKEGMTQREVAELTGVPQRTVANLSLKFNSEPNTHDAQMAQDDFESDANKSVTQMHQDETPQEPSVFQAATSFTPTENPWDTPETPTTNSEEEVSEAPTVNEEPDDPEVSVKIIGMFRGLSQIDKEELLLVLNDLAEEF
jgi:transcriptional regulator with XRE-family HTH domain